jgi:hypothetical protein
VDYIFRSEFFKPRDDPASGDWALWTATYLDNGKWTFEADTGKYANLCHDCL